MKRIANDHVPRRLKKMTPEYRRVRANALRRRWRRRQPKHRHTQSRHSFRRGAVVEVVNVIVNNWPNWNHRWRGRGILIRHKPWYMQPRWRERMGQRGVVLFDCARMRPELEGGDWVWVKFDDGTKLRWRAHRLKRIN